MTAAGPTGGSLNPEQSLVASARGRRTMVMAGAGTGKTAAAVGWVCGLLREDVPAASILMLTFTRKAAREMVARAAALSGARALQVVAGTYHAVSSGLIREDSAGFGFSGKRVTLMDAGDSRDLWKSAARACGIQAPKPAVSTLAEAVSALRNHDKDVLAGLLLRFGDKSDAAKLYQSYEKLKSLGGLLDYDDLLVRLRDRLRDSPEYAVKMRHRFRYVLVDEMQDNNLVQYQIIQYLSPDHLLVVGDINQSIYGFRAASPGLMQKFRQDWPDTCLITLTTNYRSVQPVLDLANQVIAQSEFPLVLQSVHGAAGDPPLAIRLPNPEIEASAVCERIQSLRRRGGKASDIAVLSRSSRGLLLLEIELRRARVEYRKYGGQAISEAAEVKDFSAFVRLSYNPKDRPAVIRVATMFPGVGEIGAHKAADATGDLRALPGKAGKAAEWVATMHTMSFGDSLRFLFQQIKPLILHNYPENAQERINTLGVLVEECAESDLTITDFLDAFVTERFNKDHPDEAVTLSTIHSAKGLEWTSVFLLGCGSQQMPHQRAQSAEEIAEERRLMYVGITRARRDLTITFPALYNRQPQYHSPFIPEHTKWISF